MEAPLPPFPLGGIAHRSYQRTRQLDGEMQSFYDIDELVHTALEANNKPLAKQAVYENSEVLSRRDRETLLATIERYPE